MFCKNCGTENVDGAKFCRACGAPQEQAAPAANQSYTPNQGYAPNQSYARSQGYAPNQGYVPNRAPVRKNTASGQNDIMKLVPAICGAVALICMFLPWYVISIWGQSESATLLGTAFDFESWDVGFSAILLSLLSIGCIVAAGFSIFASLKKLPYAKIVAFAGAVVALLTMFAWNSCCDSIMEGLSEYAKVGFAFYLYIIAMVGSGVVSIINEKK